MATTLDNRRRRSDLAARHRETAAETLSKKINMLGDDALLNEYETAEYLGKSVQWLRNRRINGGTLAYPRHIKIGGGVRYRFGDIRQPAVEAVLNAPQN